MSRRNSGNCRNFILFKELEVGLGDLGDGIGQTKVGQADENDAVGLEILDLASDAGKGTTDDADLAAWLGIGLIDLEGDAQALDILTGLGIDEILHLLLGDRDNLALLFPTPLGSGHELDREEVRIGVLKFTDNLLLDLDKDEIVDDRASLVKKFLMADDLAVFQAEIGGEAFLKEGITDAESFLGVGVIDIEGIPADLVIIDLEVGKRGIVGTGITVGLGLGEGCDRDIVRSVRTVCTDGLLRSNIILRTHVG